MNWHFTFDPFMPWPLIAVFIVLAAAATLALARKSIWNSLLRFGVAAFPAGSTYGGTAKINTVYSIHFDGLSILYLGALGDLELPAEVLEMDSPDILIIPIGGEGSLSPAEAQKLAVKLEAKVIIPMLYTPISLKQFLKEAGTEGVSSVEKLTLKPRDVSDKENEVVVLSA